MTFWILDFRFWIAKEQTQKTPERLSPRQKGNDPKNRGQGCAHDQASHKWEIELEVFALIRNIAGEPSEAKEREFRSGHDDQSQHDQEQCR